MVKISLFGTTKDFFKISTPIIQELLVPKFKIKNIKKKNPSMMKLKY